MLYQNLRKNFDSLAHDIFANGHLMRRVERIARVQELYGLALQTLSAAEGRVDSQDIVNSLCKILHLANNMVNSIEQCETFRGIFPQHQVVAHEMVMAGGKRWNACSSARRAPL